MAAMMVALSADSKVYSRVDSTEQRWAVLKASKKAAKTVARRADQRAVN